MASSARNVPTPERLNDGEYHLDANAINNNNVSEEHNQEKYSEEEQFGDSEKMNNEYLYEVEEYHTPFEGVSYASMASKPSLELPKHYKIDLGTRKVPVRFENWNMINIFKRGSNKFFCQVCIINDHIKFKSQHCISSKHLEKLTQCTTVRTFKDYLIRKVNDRLYHCGHCNNLQFHNQMEEHIASVHPKINRNFVETTDPVKSAKKTKTLNKTKSVNKSKTVTEPKKTESDKRAITNKNIENDKPIDCGKPKIDPNFDIFGDILLWPFGCALKIPALNFNMIMKKDGEYYCAICDRVCADVNVHVEEMKHIELVTMTPFIRLYQNHLTRAVRGMIHCSICNVLFPVAGVFDHNIDQPHTTALAAAMGMKKTQKPVNTKRDTILNLKNQSSGQNSVQNWLPFNLPVPHQNTSSNMQNQKEDIKPVSVNQLTDQVALKNNTKAPEILDNSPQSNLGQKGATQLLIGHLPQVGHHQQNLSSPGQNLPTSGQNLPTSGQNLPTSGQNLPTSAQNLPTFGHNFPFSPKLTPQVAKSIPPMFNSMFLSRKTIIITGSETDNSKAQNETHSVTDNSKSGSDNTRRDSDNTRIASGIKPVNDHSKPRKNLRRDSDNSKCSSNNYKSISNQFKSMNEIAYNMESDSQSKDDEFKEFDKEEMVFLKMKTTYFKITNMSFNTLVFLDNGTRYCFLCSSIVLTSQQTKHVGSRKHVECLARIKFVDKYGVQLFRQMYLMYHCAVCNELVTQKEIKLHLDVARHINGYSMAHLVLNKKNLKELKSGLKEYIAETQKELIYTYVNEPCYHIRAAYEIVPNVDDKKDAPGRKLDRSSSVVKKNKMVIQNNVVMKISFDHWHSITTAKNITKCVICQVEITPEQVVEHVETEYHTVALGKSFEKSYYPALVRKINEQTVNCMTCNLGLPNTDEMIHEHVSGRKHIQNHSSIVNSTTNSTVDCYQDYLTL